MSEKILIIDFETRDPYISRGLGAGWPFSVNKVPGCDFKVLGVAIRTNWIDKPTSYIDLTSANYVSDRDFINSIVQEADLIVMHNASYDLGCLKVVGIDVKDTPLIDTIIMAKLYDSSLNSYSLDFLCKKYKVIEKDSMGLVEAIIEEDIFPYLKKEVIAKEKAHKIGESYVREYDEVRLKKVNKWMYSNMDIVQKQCPEAMAKYACRDVDGTWELFDFFKNNVPNDYYKDKGGFLTLCKKNSFVIYPAMKARQQGMRVDLSACRDAIRDLQPIIEEAERIVFEMAGEEFNIQSTAKTAIVFDKLGIEYPLTDKGNPSIKADWMQQQGHKICKSIVTAKKYRKVTNDTIKKILNMQVWTLGLIEEEIAYEQYGRVYPEWKPLMQKTGRWSCTNPNITQIPKRDKKIGPICRGLFIPEEGKNFYAPDWSNQEGRIHVHYAWLLKCDGIEDYREEFLNDAKFDTHAKVAVLMDTDRTNAKVVYLAKVFGAGGAKICDQLCLPTDWWLPRGATEEVRVAGEEGKELIYAFNEAIPFVKELADKCQASLIVKGYITTLGGRRLHADWTIFKGKKIIFWYKALSQLSQGSAADQMIEVATQAYLAGLPVIGYIHDELLMSGTHKQGEQLRQIMINSVNLNIPGYVELGKGKNWAEAH